MTSRRTALELFKAVWPIATALVVVLAAFRAVGSTFLGSYALDLGSLSLPTPRYVYFLFYWTVLGSLATALLIAGMTRFMSFKAQLSPAQSASSPGRSSTDKCWLIFSMAATFLVAAMIRTLVLRGGPLTDDESAYRFQAQLLARGRLWLASYPHREFFDRNFMINDGRFYSQYFIGWPLLMVPGVYLRMTGYMNAVYASLTVPALFFASRRLAGSAAARVVTILFMAAPMLMIGAATELSHTSCMLALAWGTYFVLRAREAGAPWWCHAALAGCCSLAFLIRPTSALGVASPLVVAWALALKVESASRRWRALATFAVPAVLMATLFFGVNYAQNGSPFVTSCQRMIAFMHEINFRNMAWTAESPFPSIGDYILPHGRLREALGYTTVALVRFVFDMFGSPWLLVLVGLAWRARPARLLWGSALCFVCVHGFMTDSGIDSFGPVHCYELALPILLLGGIGFQRLTSIVRELKPTWAPSWPLVSVACMVLVALIGYLPVRTDALNAMMDNINEPDDAVKRTGIHNAVVFMPRKLDGQRCPNTPHHFVFFRPNNDPGLENDVLWLNHVGIDQDRALMPSFPGRTGYLLQWKGCDAHLAQLD